MSFIRACDLRAEAKQRTHWAPRDTHTRELGRASTTLCGRFLFIGGRFGRGVCYAEYDPQYVTCRVCLYHMGLYTPLAKLREHQYEQRVSAMVLGPPTNSWAAYGMHSENP